MNTNDLKWIFPIQSLTSTQKVMLADVIIHKECDDFTASECYNRLQIEKHTYNKQLRDLVKRRIVLRVNRFDYKLNLNDLF